MVTFDHAKFRTWAARLGGLLDRTRPAGRYELFDRLTGVVMPVGLYVGVEEDDILRYVGKVCRSDNGIDDRLASHHQPVDSWTAVWLLPLRHDVPNMIVSNLESRMISALRPPDNSVGKVQVRR